MFDRATLPSPCAATELDSRTNLATLTTNDMDVVFQPIVDLGTGHTMAYEALARCKWPQFKNPTLLFEAAQQQGAVGRMGRIIRDVAFQRCDDVPLFVNIHPRELNEGWLVRPDDPIFFHDRAVYLEITESAAFDYFDLCLGVLREVASRGGGHLVVDDLGAGHSNLKRILDLEPDVVKLDIALVRGIEHSRRQQILVTQVVNLCEQLGAQVVAEGIETVEELRAILDTGAHYGQGFLFGRPSYPPPRASWPIDRPQRSPRGQLAREPGSSAKIRL